MEWQLLHLENPLFLYEWHVFHEYYLKDLILTWGVRDLEQLYRLSWRQCRYLALIIIIELTITIFHPLFANVIDHTKFFSHFKKKRETTKRKDSKKMASCDSPRKNGKICQIKKKYQFRFNYGVLHFHLKTGFLDS